VIGNENDMPAKHSLELSKHAELAWIEDCGSGVSAEHLARGNVTPIASIDDEVHVESEPKKA
jgi:hypothetical protein